MNSQGLHAQEPHNVALYANVGADLITTSTSQAPR
jgi:hypothetical protein